MSPCRSGAGNRTQNAASEPASSVEARITQPISGGLEK